MTKKQLEFLQANKHLVFIASLKSNNAILVKDTDYQAYYILTVDCKVQDIVHFHITNHPE